MRVGGGPAAAGWKVREKREVFEENDTEVMLPATAGA